MSIVQIFTYVAYAFGLAFLIGSGFLLFNIFGSNETKEEKAARKAEKERARLAKQDPDANAGSFFAKQDETQFVLPTGNNDAPRFATQNLNDQPITIQNSDNHVPLSQNNPQPVQRNIPQQGNVTPNKPQPSQQNPNFVKPKFGNGDSNTQPKTDNGKFNLPF
jgi:hypothetical protein